MDYAHEAGRLKVQRDNLLRQITNLIDAMPDKERLVVIVAQQEKERIEREKQKHEREIYYE